MQPQTIGRYRVVSLLGQGAMGVVYAARDEQMDRDVAVKMMSDRLEADEGARRRFFREAQLTSKLLHRNIVTVFDLGEVNGHPYIVMELLKGNTLSHALREPRLESVEARLDLMIQACEGLARAHAAGVVHRDIKPTNLFVLPDGSLKILDFGVARLTDSSVVTRAGMVIGTPDYMSPEQARGDEVDARSDVFSLAAVFYFMVTGRRPFEGPDVPTVLRRVVNDDPAPIRTPDVPAALVRIIGRAMRKQADHRYQSCADLAGDLTRVRRHYDAETHRLAEALKQQFDRIQSVGRGMSRLRTELGRPTDDVADVAAEVRMRYPFLDASDLGSPALGIPWHRNRLQGIGVELDRARMTQLTELESLAVTFAEPEGQKRTAPIEHVEQPLDLPLNTTPVTIASPDPGTTRPRSSFRRWLPSGRRD